MLILLIFAIAFVKGLIAYIIGVTVALVLWLIGKIFNLSINVWLRWGTGTFVVILYSLKMMSKKPLENMGYGIIQYWSEGICYVLAVVLLIITGILIGITRTVIK